MQKYVFIVELLAGYGAFDSLEVECQNFKKCLEKVKDWALGRGGVYSMRIVCDGLQTEKMFEVSSNGLIAHEQTIDTSFLPYKDTYFKGYCY